MRFTVLFVTVISLCCGLYVPVSLPSAVRAFLLLLHAHLLRFCRTHIPGLTTTFLGLLTYYHGFVLALPFLLFALNLLGLVRYSIGCFVRSPTILCLFSLRACACHHADIIPPPTFFSRTILPHLHVSLRCHACGRHRWTFYHRRRLRCLFTTTTTVRGSPAVFRSPLAPTYHRSFLPTRVPAVRPAHRRWFVLTCVAFTPPLPVTTTPHATAAPCMHTVPDGRTWSHRFYHSTFCKIYLLRSPYLPPPVTTLPPHRFLFTHVSFAYSLLQCTRPAFTCDLDSFTFPMPPPAYHTTCVFPLPACTPAWLRF